MNKLDKSVDNSQVSSESTQYDNRSRLIVTDLNKRIILFSYATNTIAIFDSINKCELFQLNSFIDDEITQITIVPQTDDILIDEECGFMKYNKYYIQIENETTLNYFKFENSTVRDFKIRDDCVYLIENNKLLSFSLTNAKETKSFSVPILLIEFAVEVESDGILDFEIIPSMDYVIVLNAFNNSKRLSLYSIRKGTKLVEINIDNNGDYSKLLSNGEYVFINDSWKNKVNRYLIIEASNENYEKQLELIKLM